jgi:hypothetical protein
LRGVARGCTVVRAVERLVLGLIQPTNGIGGALTFDDQWTTVEICSYDRSHTQALLHSVTAGSCFGYGSDIVRALNANDRIDAVLRQHGGRFAAFAVAIALLVIGLILYLVLSTTIPRLRSADSIQQAVGFT